MTDCTRSTSLPWQTLTLAACALLQACGGGGSGDAGTPVTSLSTISAATPDRLSYGRMSTFAITGTNLASAVSFPATGCDGLAVLAGGSVSQQTVTCTPNQALSVRLVASYAVFGRITGDLAVIDAISTVATRSVGGNGNVPATDIVVTTAAQTL